MGKAAVTTGLVVLIMARCVDRVLWTRMTFIYTPFLWYLSNIILPFAFVVTSWPVVWYKTLFSPSDITPEMRRFPLYKFALMAAFDTAFNVLSAFPTPHLGGDFTNILSQMVLPVNMVLAIIFLGTRYKRNHYLGVILVIYGVFVNFMPELTGQSTGRLGPGAIFWIAVYLISLVPAAMGNVYKEIGLNDVDLDIWYAGAWISIFQVMWAIGTVWTITVPPFQDPPLSWSEFPDYVRSATSCFLGRSVVVPHSEQIFECENSYPYIIFLYFIFFNVIYNQLTLYIFKNGGSVLCVLTSAICLPLTDILYNIPFLAGPEATESFTIYDGFALFVMVIAILVFYSQKEERKDKSSLKTYEKSPAFNSPTMNRMKSFLKKMGRGNTPKDNAGKGALEDPCDVKVWKFEDDMVDDFSDRSVDENGSKGKAPRNTNQHTKLTHALQQNYGTSSAKGGHRRASAGVHGTRRSKSPGPNARV